MNTEVDSLTEGTKEMQGEGGAWDAKGISLRSRRRRRSVATPPCHFSPSASTPALVAVGGGRKGRSRPLGDDETKAGVATLVSYIGYPPIRSVADKE